MTWDDFTLAFFSLDILRQAWPILLSGLVQTVLLSAMVVPLGPRRAACCWRCSPRCGTRWCAGR